MTKLPALQKLLYASICTALCVVLPMALHFIPNAGTLLSPMHLPVLLCGIICGWQWGLLCGILGPLLSSVITGMPPAVILPVMIIELAVYGLVSGVMMSCLHTGRQLADLYISLFTAMLAGRIIAGLARGLYFSAGNYSLAIWANSYFLSTLPGMLLQLLLIPIIFIALKRAKLLSYMSEAVQIDVTP